MTKTNIYVALDRSGSMSGEKWSGAISSLNLYVSELKKKKVKGQITIVAFDTPGVIASKTSYEFLTKDLSIQSYSDLDHKTVCQPRGTTPLYDASAHVIDLANDSRAKRNVIVIITDGEENSSTEFNQHSVKAKVSDFTAKGNEVIFLGANFDASVYSRGAGLSNGKTTNYDLTIASSISGTMRTLAASTVNYAHTGKEMSVS